MHDCDLADQQLDELPFWREHLMLIVTTYPGQAQQGPMPAPDHLRPALLKGPIPFIREATQDELVQYLKDHPQPSNFGTF